MNISGFNKLTLLDYPNKVACIIFTQGCNYCCRYCQNSALIRFNKENLIREDDVISYLVKRQKVLDGIVISGGEPTMQDGLVLFLKKIKELNLLVKLDTNGSNPEILKKIIDENLVDYIAMDIKADFVKYEEITNCKVNTCNLQKSIKLVIKSGIDYEFRTTIIKGAHTIKDIENILNYLPSEAKYYLQNFRDSDGVLDKTLQSFSKEELELWQNELKQNHPNLRIRGL